MKRRQWRALQIWRGRASWPRRQENRRVLGVCCELQVVNGSQQIARKGQLGSAEEREIATDRCAA